MVSLPLFRHLLGEDLDGLAPALRNAHGQLETIKLVGVAQVWRADTLVGNLLCDVLGLPNAGSDVPVRVTFERRGPRERWYRDFAGRQYCSYVSARAGLLVERMGPVTNLFRLSVQERKLRLILVGFRVLGIPMPLRLRPRCDAVEGEEDGAFTFDIPISLPLLGPVIRYSGRMVPERELTT